MKSEIGSLIISITLKFEKGSFYQSGHLSEMLGTNLITKFFESQMTSLSYPSSAKVAPWSTTSVQNSHNAIGLKLDSAQHLFSSVRDYVDGGGSNV